MHSRTRRRTEVGEAEAEGDELRVGALQVRLRLLHDRLQDGGRHAAVTAADGDHPTRQHRDADHLKRN